MAVSFVQGPRIAAGEALSDVLDCSTQAPTRITMPAGWTSSNLTFQISSDGVRFSDLFDSAGREVMVSVTPGVSARLSTGWIVSPCYLKFRSGTRDHPVAQEAERLFECALEMPATTGGGGGEVPAAEPGMEQVAYVARTTDMVITDNFNSYIETPNVMLDAGSYSVRFFAPGLALDATVEGVVTLQQNGITIGNTESKRSNFDHTEVPIEMSAIVEVATGGNIHKFSAMVHKYGFGGAWLKAGPGGTLTNLAAYLEVVKVK